MTKTGKSLIWLVCVVVMLAAVQTRAQSNSPYKFQGGFPASNETIMRARDATDLRRAIEAYKFFFPTVATEAVMQQFEPHGAIPNKVGIIMPQDPEQQFSLANQDTPYVITVLDLKAAGPIVVDIPEGPYVGIVNDHNMEWIGDAGLIGPGQGKGEIDVILPPGYKGEVPKGFHPYYSKTWKVVLAVRILSATGSYEEALSYAHKLKLYPLKEAGKPSLFRVIDIAGKKAPLPILSWEKNMDYWRQLHAVIDAEPVTERYLVMLGMLAQLGIEKGKPFAPDKRLEQILTNASQIGFEEMNVSFFANPHPEIIVWKGRKWQWAPASGPLDPATKEFGSKNYRDLLSSDHYFWSSWGTSAAIGRREVGGGSLYCSWFADATKRYLHGGKNYQLTIPGPVPADLFWSVTVYDSETRCIINSGQGRGAVRLLHEKPKGNPDGSFDIFFGPDAPAGKKNQWVKTMPGKGWFAVVRMYGPQKPIFDGSYKLPDIVQLK